jgi:hypothetical protein
MAHVTRHAYDLTAPARPRAGVFARIVARIQIAGVIAFCVAVVIATTQRMYDLNHWDEVFASVRLTADSTSEPTAELLWHYVTWASLAVAAATVIVLLLSTLGLAGHRPWAYVIGRLVIMVFMAFSAVTLYGFGSALGDIRDPNDIRPVHESTVPAWLLFVDRRGFVMVMLTGAAAMLMLMFRPKRR